MKRRTHELLWGACLWTLGLGLSASATAAIEAEHESDYVRVLESEQTWLWSEAVAGLLGDTAKPELPRLAVSSVVRRLASLPARQQARVALALRRSPRHPLVLPSLLALRESHDEAVRTAALDSLLTLRSPGALDSFRDLILARSPRHVEALQSLQKTYDHYLEAMADPYFGAVAEPVLQPENGTPEEIFDRRYLDALRSLLREPKVEVRRKALKTAAKLFTPGVDEELFWLTLDTDEKIRSDARWELARRGDPRPCPVLIDQELRKFKTSGDAYPGSVGFRCAANFYLSFIERYRKAASEAERDFFRDVIEGAEDDVVEVPGVHDALRRLAADPDPFLSATAHRLLDRHATKMSREKVAVIHAGLPPVALAGLSSLAAVLGVTLFVWAWRLVALARRVQNRPISKIRSAALGPVALEGWVRAAGSELRHPLTEEGCVYYAGAEVDHPDARILLEDETGRVLVDPRRAVLFSEDGVLVAGERVHVAGSLQRQGSTLVVSKDDAPQAAYRRMLHRLIEVLFGFGRATHLTKMLFSDPQRCFWIWDDLERRPMGETRDYLWPVAGVLLSGSWILIFAIALMALIDQEMSATLARASQAMLGADFDWGVLLEP